MGVDQEQNQEQNIKRLTKEEITKYLETCPEDEKGRKIVPDDFFDLYYKELPNACINQSGTYQSFNSGKLIMLGGDRERDLEIQRAGREAQAATYRKRRSMKEDIELMLARFDANEGMTEQEKGLAAMLRTWQDGNVKAGQFLRDTVGEQPVTKQEIQADIMTDADKQIIANALKRLKGQETEQPK